MLTYRSVKDGDVISVQAGEQILVKCCDCGLVHRYVFAKRTRFLIFRNDSVRIEGGDGFEGIGRSGKQGDKVTKK